MKINPLIGHYSCLKSKNRTLKIMKVTLFMMFVCAFQLMAFTGKAQNAVVKLSSNTVTVKTLFAEIEEQTDYLMAFRDQELDQNTIVTLKDKEGKVSEILDEVLEGTDLAYDYTNNYIVVSKNVEKNNAIQQNSKKITGIVKDKNGEPIIGANVLIKGEARGAVTDLDGRFTLDVPTNAILQVSYIGYTSQNVTVGNRSNIEVVLNEDSAALEEVVVIGYGTAKRKDMTGSVIQVRPDRIAAENPQSVQDVLRGSAGLAVGMSNDAKGGGSLQIRGQRSVYSDGGHNDPLLILDGMQFYGELSEINPDDIEQIDVLKDASSAAVYGAKAANGVIIITTKKGKEGKPVINFTANLGLTTRADYEKYFTVDQYLQHKVDFFESNTYDFDESGNWSAYAKGSYGQNYFTNPNNLPAGVTLDQWRGYTTQDSSVSDQEIWLRRINFTGNLLENALAGNISNWEDYVYQTGIQQDYNVSISGASPKVNYYISAGYLHNEGVRKEDYYRSIRMNAKLNTEITSWLSAGMNLNFQDRSDDSRPISTAVRDNSPFADIYNPETGEFAQYPNSSDYSMRGSGDLFTRQFRELEQGYTVLNSQFNVKVKLPFNISYDFNFAPRYEFFNQREFLSADLPDSKPIDRGANRNTSKRFDWSLNNIITWNQKFGKHDVTLTLVQEAEERRYWSEGIGARDISPTDALGFHYIAGANKEASNFWTNDTHETADALMARAQYNFDDRYLLSGSIRRDGYCAFGANNPHATFPSIAAGWVFSNEAFWEKFSHIMDYGKLRLSYGLNGNRSLANPYVALSNLTTGSYAQYYYGGSINDMVYLRVDRLANPNLKWEKSAAYNIGLDFSFLSGRISGNMEFYLTQTKDMIMRQTLPNFIGFSNITTNLGQVDNKGFELTLNSRNIDTKNFKWNTSLTFAYNRNEIVHLYGEYDENGKEMDDVSNNWFIGHSINEIWDYEVLGIWQVNEAEEAAKYGQQPGDPKVWNNPSNDKQNADGTTTIVYDNNDKKFLGQRNAPVRWSMRNDFTLFKNISIGFSLYSRMGWKACRDGIYANDGSDAFLNYDNGGGYLLYKMQNQPWKRYWTPETPYNDVARIEAVGPTGAQKPRMYLNRNFIRFDNLSVAYTFPKNLIQKAALSNLKLFFNVKNLGTIHSSDWYYGDPENMSHSTRTYTFGINATI